MLKELRPNLDSATIEAAAQQTYCDAFLRALGAENVESLDYSDYEGATIIHDFNSPISAELEGRFDLVIEGGSIEHIFDTKTSFKNLMKLVRPGGHILVSQMANNFLGHGFYQFSPDLFYRTFSKENGFTVRYCGVHEDHFYAPFYAMPDPMDIKSRIEATSNHHGMYIIVLARKDEDKPLFQSSILQSDYTLAWENHKNTSEASPGKAPTPNTKGHSDASPDANVGIVRRIIVGRHRIFWNHQWLAACIVRVPAWLRRRRQFSVDRQRAKFRRNSLKLRG